MWHCSFRCSPITCWSTSSSRSVLDALCCHLQLTEGSYSTSDQGKAMMLSHQQYSQEPADLRHLRSSDTSKMGTVWVIFGKENCFSGSRIFPPCVLLVLLFSGQNCAVLFAGLKRISKKFYTRKTVFTVGAGRRCEECATTWSWGVNWSSGFVHRIADVATARDPEGGGDSKNPWRL